MIEATITIDDQDLERGLSWATRNHNATTGASLTREEFLDLICRRALKDYSSQEAESVFDQARTSYGEKTEQEKAQLLAALGIDRTYGYE